MANTTDELDLSGILAPGDATSTAVSVPSEPVMPFGEPGLRASVAKETDRALSIGRGGRVPLYFDIETVPDESRLERFGLEPLPTARPRTPRAVMQTVADARGKSLDDLRKALVELNPEESWLSEFESAEKADKKPRKGVFDLLAEIRGEEQRIAAAVEERRKLLSVTPEFCRIVAIGMARGTGLIESAAVGSDVTEIDLIESFWSDAEESHPIVGFNVLGFDLPTIMVRSFLLGIRPSRRFDLSPWKDDVIDLYVKRFPRGASGEDKTGKPSRLKTLARAYGIDAPAGDLDGSQVERLWRENPAKLAEYVSSDVHLAREVHRLYRGMFC